MARRLSQRETDAPHEIAPGVYWLEVGRGLMRSNVYLVQSGASWALIDAGSAKCAPAIQRGAELLFGEDSPPAAIVLTHDHPDHAGAARELAKIWRCSVWVHPDELPLVLGDISIFHEYANPLDRWLILPLLRLMGPKRTESIVSQASLRDVARPFDPGAELPGLLDWEVVPTPGHTPGHVAFFRRSDRVLISGDALVSVDLNSPWGLLLGTESVFKPPWYTTWNWRMAADSVTFLTTLEPLVLGGGHGDAMAGSEVAGRVRMLSKGRA